MISASASDAASAPSDQRREARAALAPQAGSPDRSSAVAPICGEPPACVQTSPPQAAACKLGRVPEGVAHRPATAARCCCAAQQDKMPAHAPVAAWLETVCASLASHTQVGATSTKSGSNDGFRARLGRMESPLAAAAGQGALDGQGQLLQRLSADQQCAAGLGGVGSYLPPQSVPIRAGRTASQAHLRACCARSVVFPGEDPAGVQAYCTPMHA